MQDLIEARRAMSDDDNGDRPATGYEDDPDSLYNYPDYTEWKSEWEKTHFCIGALYQDDFPWCEILTILRDILHRGSPRHTAPTTHWVQGIQ